MQDLSERKSNLEVANESLRYEMKTSVSKTQRDYELKYQREIREYKLALGNYSEVAQRSQERLNGHVNVTPASRASPQSSTGKYTKHALRASPRVIVLFCDLND